MNVIRFICAALLLLVFGISLPRSDAAAPGSAECCPITQEDKAFLQSLKKAIGANEAAWIADKVDFPLRVRIQGRLRPIKNEQQFIFHFREIINDEVRKAVANQDKEMLWKNSEGVMIGNGQIWFAECPDDGKSYKHCIVAINNDYRPRFRPR